ncbi:hypothetical protein BC833DRAFT_601121 [Globomyces pollinis-pini]|nr:hypothetical protein BC833DRAFT_601121 [Globomyces pollinis-pini]
MPPSRLTKSKINKAKKGIQALVLTSGAATIVGFPSFFSYLPFNESIKRTFTKIERTSNVPLTVGLANSRRAQSVCTLPPERKIQNQPEDDFDEFEAECAAIESHRTGLILALEQTPIEVDKRYPGLRNQKPQPLPSRTQPHHPLKSRRIQSAPCVVLSLLPPNLLDEMDAWDNDEHTLNEEWIVPSVREKAITQNQNNSTQIVETWDDDFDVEDENDIDIPTYMKSIQTKFKTDMLHMRKFALHMQDLKHIFANANVLESAMNKQFKSNVTELSKVYQSTFDQINVLIHLADYKEDGTGPNLTESDLTLLYGMLQDCDDREIHEMFKKKNVMFGNIIMNHLLERISPLKRELVDYVRQLRELMTL